jgi:hypothetical protein
VIYILFFLISCLFFWLSEKCKNRIARNLLAIIAILIPCILAGLRSDTIGTDVKVYVEPMYNAAKESHNLTDYMNQRWFVIWRYMYVNKFEIGFSFMIYFIQKFGGSLSIVLFFIQLLIIAPIYIGLKKINKPYPICFCMLVFFLLFYNTSLNMMRQWIAMAILFMAFSYLILGERKIYYILTLVACLFHTSAVMGFVISFIYRYCTKTRESFRISNFKLYQGLAPIKIFVYGCIALLSLSIIALILDRIGLSKYSGYIKGDNGLYLLPNQILIRLPIIILFLIRWKKILKEDKLAPFYGSMFVLDLLTSQLMSINAYAFRIGSFFTEYNILSYSALIYAGNRKFKTNRYMTFLYVVGYLVYYWIFYYVVTGNHATFPYVFA